MVDNNLKREVIYTIGVICMRLSLYYYFMLLLGMISCPGVFISRKISVAVKLRMYALRAYFCDTSRKFPLGAIV